VADIKLTVEMIGFVEQGAGQQLLASFFEDFSLEILRAHGDLIGAGNVLAKVGDTEASFALLVLALGVDDYGIDDDKPGVRVFFEGYVDDRDAASDADLRRGEADAVRGVHRLEHVIGELFQVIVENGDCFGRPLKDRVAKFYDWIDHLSLDLFRSVFLQLLTVTFEISLHFEHGVAAEFFEGTPGDGERDHRFGRDAGRWNYAHVGALVSSFDWLAG